MPGRAVGGWQYPMDLPRARGRRWRVAHSPTTPQGLQQQTSFSMREEDLGNFGAGSMRQREHLDDATVACWVTFCAEAIRPLTLFAAPQKPAYEAFANPGPAIRAILTA